MKVSRRSRWGLIALAVVAVLLGALAWLVSAPPRRPVVVSQPAPRLRIEGATIVDPRDGRLVPDMVIETEGGRIVAVARTGTLTASPSIRRIDARGTFVVPGYNNMHVHALDRDRTGALALMLADGTTGMRQMSGTDEDLADRREHRLPLTGDTPALLAMPGPVLIPFNAGSPDEARREVARQKAAGADFIKVAMLGPDAFWAALAASRQAGLPIVGHLQPGIDPARAARAGFRSIEHLGPGDPIWIACSTDRGALFAESAAHPMMKAPPVHIPYLDRFVMWRLQTLLINPAAFAKPADIARLGQAIATYDPARCATLARIFIAHGTWNVPTLVRLRNQYLADDPAYQHDPYLRYMPQSNIDSWREVTRKFAAMPPATRATYRAVYAHALMLTKLFSDLGVPMMTGTDGGGYSSPGQSLHQEFDELARAGIAPLKILQMTTTAPAAFLGRTATMGRVAVGYDADLVLLDGNPVESEANMKRIAGVVRAGHYHGRRNLAAIRARVAAEQRR